MLDKLHYLIALAQEQHFGRAAEACGVTQPTLSAGISSWRTCSACCWCSGSRFHAFTPEGQRTLEWARRMVADERALRQEMRALKQGLVGHVRIAAVPTALAMVASLTTPYRARHPDVSFTVLSCNSIEVLGMLENLEVDAGLTYVDNEPVGRARTVPLYREHYRLLTAADSLFGDREEVSWAEVAQVPLCLLTPDMQNRRIIDRFIRNAGTEPAPTLESNSMILLFSHVRTGRWASVMPARLAEVLGLTETIRAIPIRADEPYPTIGLVVPHRDPMTPLTAALVVEARRLGRDLADLTA
jgi:DNA-binding transcriptional LysR family regulator